MIPELQITVKPALGDHPFVKLKVVAQNRWSLNEGSLTGTGIVTVIKTALTSCVNDNRLILSVRHNNWLILIIGKMANNWLIAVIGRFLRCNAVMLARSWEL